MRIIKAGLTGLRAPDLVGKSEHVESKMTGNVNFVNPTPGMANMTAARLALVAALAEAMSGSHAAIATKNSAAKTLSTMLVQLARYVNSVAGGDIDIAVSSGFELAKTPEPIDELDAPKNFNAYEGTIAGEIHLRWKGVRGGRLYKVYICDGDPTTTGTWTEAGMCSAGRFTVKGLVTDKQYSFRVTALGRVGEGPVSEVVTAKAA